jgi:hypothetical protein
LSMGSCSLMLFFSSFLLLFKSPLYIFSS